VISRIKTGKASEVIRGFLFFVFFTPLWSVDRAVTLEGIKKVRSSRYRSVIELVRFELKHNRRESALTKLNYHLDNNPNDSEALEMLGDIQLEDGQRHLAIATFERATALGSRSASIKLKQLLALVENDKSLILKETGFTNLFLDPDSFSIKPVENKPAQVLDNKLTKGGMQELSLLRTLDSLVSAYTQNIGPMKEFSLQAIKSSRILTREIDISSLGEIHLEGGKVKSSIYGTYADQKTLQETLQKAYKIFQEGNCPDALKLLQSVELPSVSELRFALELSRQCGSGSELELRQKLLNLDKSDLENLMWMANRAYETGDHKTAKGLYTRLLGSTYATEAQRQIKIIDGGGSHQLRELLRKQRENK